MMISFRQAAMKDTGLLVDIYNAAFSATICDSMHARDMARRSK